MCGMLHWCYSCYTRFFQPRKLKAGRRHKIILNPAARINKKLARRYQAARRKLNRNIKAKLALRAAKKKAVKHWVLKMTGNMNRHGQRIDKETKKVLARSERPPHRARLERKVKRGRVRSIAKKKFLLSKKIIRKQRRGKNREARTDENKAAAAAM